MSICISLSARAIANLSSPCIIARHVDMRHLTRPASGAKRKGSGSIPSLSILPRGNFVVIEPTKNTDSTVIFDWILW